MSRMEEEGGGGGRRREKEGREEYQDQYRSTLGGMVKDWLHT